jgi:hypothetical protein
MTDNRHATWQHLSEAEYRIAALVGMAAPDAADAAMTQARALLALIWNVITTDAKPEGSPETPQEPARQRHYRITARHLKSVVATYQADTNGAPTRAVADRFNVHHSTAAKWVGRARKEGLLPQTTARFAAKGGVR